MAGRDEDDAYRRKLQEMLAYKPFLEKMIGELASKSGTKSSSNLAGLFQASWSARPVEPTTLSLAK